MTGLKNRYEDDDASRLPPGMKRVGYDADTERYTFREGDDLWLGEPGSLYGGRMKWAGKAPDAAPKDNKGGGKEVSESESAITTGLKLLPADQPLRRHVRSALSRSSASSLPENGSDWGVPTVSISETSAEPPDKPRDETTLKRRATRLKEIALSTAGTIGVVHGWQRTRDHSRSTRKRRSSRH